MPQRKRNTKVFKLGAINLVLEQGYNCIEASRSPNVHKKTLSRWIRKSRDGGDDAFHVNGNRTSEQEELHRLREEK